MKTTKRVLVNEMSILRHAGDVCFLWERRQRTLRTNELKGVERARLDMRLEGHLDGLRVAGEAGWQAAIEELHSSRRNGAFFATAALALHSGRVRHLEEVLDLAAAEDGPWNALVSAGGWSDLKAVHSCFDGWNTSADVARRVLGIRGLGVHRSPPGELAANLRAPQASVRAAASKAAGELGNVELAAPLRPLLTDDAPHVRLAAARALARLGDSSPKVTRALLALIDSGGPFAAEAVAPLVTLDPRSAHALFKRLGAASSSRRLASLVAATLGDAALVDTLIPWMNDDDTARAAGEAFRTITGADLRDCRLARRRPAYVAGDPTNDPGDPDVTLNEEYELAFPSALLVARWWKTHRAEFPAGTRYLDGNPVGTLNGEMTGESEAALLSLARTGRPRHQVMAARALAQRYPDRPAIETHAPATNVHPLPGWSAWTAREPSERASKREASRHS